MNESIFPNINKKLTAFNSEKAAQVLDTFQRLTAINRSQESTYDIIVIGGGITGAGIAMDAALRGLSVLLLEKGDFASGTSSKSGKLVHGGLRYLSNGRFKLVFESCAERYKLARCIAPHIVKPTMFLVPTYSGYRVSRAMMMMGVCLYTLLAIFRNIGPVKLYSKKETLGMEGSLASTGLHGAVSFYDCRANDTRLVIDTLKAAFVSGAEMLNYCEVRALHLDTKIKRVSVYDVIGGQDFVVQGQVVINAGGAWADEIIAMAERTTPYRTATKPADETENPAAPGTSISDEASLSEKKAGTSPSAYKKFNLKRAKGIHILLPREVLNIANTLSMESPADSRGLYIVPWREALLIGTTDTFHYGSCDDLTVEAEEIDYLLAALRKLLPGVAVLKEQVLAAYAGVRPLIGSDQDINEDAMSRDYEIISDRRGLLSISGGKLTTYRVMARRMVDNAVRFLGNELVKRTVVKNPRAVPISGGNFLWSHRRETIAAYQERYGQGRALTEQLFARYGTNCEEILRRLVDAPALARPLASNINYIYGEIDYIATAEFVESISDVMFRRTAIALITPDNGLGVLEELAEYIGGKCGWSKERIERDIAAYRREIAKMRQAYAP